MRKTSKKFIALCACACIGTTMLTGCKNSVPKETSSEVTSETNSEAVFSVTLPTGAEDCEVYVEAVPNLSDDFIKGMDASSVLVEENSGVKYYNFDGEEQDVFQTFAEAGVNCYPHPMMNGKLFMLYSAKLRKAVTLAFTPLTIIRILQQTGLQKKKTRNSLGPEVTLLSL